MPNRSINPNLTKALLIGVSDFEHMPRIEPATNNIEDLAGLLSNPKIFGLSPKNIVQIINRRNDQILYQIVSFLEDKSNIDTETLLLYYVGHGYRETNSKELYLTGNNSNAKIIERSGIPFSEIKQLIEKSQIQQRIVILDACHSGLATLSDELKYSESELDIKGSYILASSAGDQKSFYNDKERNTFFTGELIKLLKTGSSESKPPKEYLTLEDVFIFLQKQPGYSKPQRKNTLNVTDFNMFRNLAFDNVAELLTKADEFCADFEFEKARDIYREILDEKDDPKIREKIKDCKIKIEFGRKIIEKQRLQNDAIKGKVDELAKQNAENKKLREESKLREEAEKRKTENLAKQNAENKKLYEKAIKDEIPEKIKSLIEQFAGNVRQVDWLDFRDGTKKKYGFCDDHQLGVLCDTQKDIFLMQQQSIKVLEKSEAEIVKDTNTINKIIDSDFVLVNGSTFLMDKHKVRLSDFYMSKYQVTQADYEKLTHKNPSFFRNNPNNPVENVRWLDAKDYCNLLNKTKGLSPVYDEEGNLLDEKGKITRDITKVFGYRLPTEAEWEYAAKGGQKSKGFEFSGSNNLDEVGWFWENSGDEKLTGEWNSGLVGKNHCKTHPVGQKNPNEIGLYDMSGNVWEWCFDSYSYYPVKEVENPIGPESDEWRVLRGGSWVNGAALCQTANRNTIAPNGRDRGIGFRLVFVPQLKGVAG